MLIVNSSILYPYTNFSSDTYKEGWEVRFTLEEDVKDGKARLTFSDLVMYVPPHICGYYYTGQTSSYQKELTADEMEKVRPIFLAFPEKLGAFINEKGMEGNW